MGWQGINNLPPGFDVFAGKAARVSLVDQVIRGHIEGLNPAQQEQFRDLKRHLLHLDNARFFEACLVCAGILQQLEGGKDSAEGVQEIVEPALLVAIEQMESIRGDVVRRAKLGRKPEHGASSSLDQLHRKSRPIALAYPQAERASLLDSRYSEITDQVRAALSRVHPRG